MPKKIMYRRELLRAVDAFLEGTPSSLAQAHRIIQHCNAAICEEEARETLNDIIWGFTITALTDSVFYTSEIFLREAREMLLGRVTYLIK